ncbi:hypothetical protein QQS21_003168 [Conoideocrella luteorostrata]|uniref:Uncharacterized protein n=1 Tax=Conoideocrella luteorostrata TaxID=1105319 RepID=A0AAJ0CWQ4_9HYPO|nr:hypothetical protein QQS21_003168 [Conoideocrella luteorostrata]
MKPTSLVVLSFLGPAVASATALAERECTSFTSALTLEKLCCDTSTNSLIFVDKPLGLGICCALGSILEGLKCVPAPTPEPSPICSGKSVCPQKSGTDLGIKYGHCYALKSLNEQYLGHDSGSDTLAGTRYVVDGETPGVVFRVCADKDTCNTSVDKLIGVSDTWWMQDQFGVPTGTGFGWLGKGGGPDLAVAQNSTGALVVGGSSLCFGGKCSICITFPPGGASAPCPLPPGQSHLGVSNNPNHCQVFYWEEVGCRSEK